MPFVVPARYERIKQIHELQLNPKFVLFLLEAHHVIFSRQVVVGRIGMA